MGNYTPDETLETVQVSVSVGECVPVTVSFRTEFAAPEYVFICILACPGVQIATSDAFHTGVMSLVHRANKKVAEGAVQLPAEGSGFDSFEFWLPERRPIGKLPAVTICPPIPAFAVEQLSTSYQRPFIQSNAWVADPDDNAPTLHLQWVQPQQIEKVVLYFDVDYDHAMETVQWHHPEDAMPFCVKHYRLTDAQGLVLAEDLNNYQGRVELHLAEPVATDGLKLEMLATHGAPASLFAIQVFGA